MQDKEPNKFTFNYSAPTDGERRIIEDIRRQYCRGNGGEDAFTELMRLHALVRKPPMALAVCMCVFGVLVFGLGLTMCLEWSIYVWGAAVAAVGCIPAAFAYPAYRRLLNRNKRKYGARIIKLTDGLLNESNAKD